MTIPINELPERAAKFTAGDIVPLDSLSAPLVGEMQAVIRAQQALLEKARHAIVYLLARKCKVKELQHLFHATEVEDRLVTFLSQMENRPRNEVARAFNAFHRSGSTYGCIDDPLMEEEA